jgi:hypothetical protein
MKITFLAAGTLALILCGCVNRYDITLRSGNVTTSKGKPRLNERGYYVFTDVEGNEQELYQGQIREIAPHSDKANKKNKAAFFNTPSK